MRVCYEQTRIYAPKKAKLTQSLRQANDSSIHVVCILHDDVVPYLMCDADNKVDFPLVRTSSNLKLEVFTCGGSQRKGAGWNGSS